MEKQIPSSPSRPAHEPPTHTFVHETKLPFPHSEVFAWHTRPGAFERLNPPWRPVKVIQAPKSLHVGEIVKIGVPIIGKLAIPWTLEHTEFEEGIRFCDTQRAGPFAAWHHQHSFIPVGDDECIMHDEISYALPRRCDWLAPFVTRELRRLFHFRHTLLAADLELHDRWRTQPRKKILIAGASGFLGTAISAFLATAGHTVTRLVRRTPTAPDERQWDPSQRSLDPALLDGIDVVINLSGEDIAASAWHSHRKLAIVKSRVDAAATITEAFLKAQSRPSLLLSASAIGYYGDTGSDAVDEHASQGKGFLSDVCKAWEDATIRLSHTSCRVVHARFGVVFNPQGGALKRMLPPFQCGVGGPLGSGKQYVSWIALQDLLGIIEHLIYSSDVRGPVNVVAPNPITNEEFTRALGRVLKRPTLLRLPASVLRGVFGEMAEETLLASTRVLPSVLQEAESPAVYNYLFPDIESALRFEVGVP